MEFPSFTCVRYTTVLFELSIDILLEFLVTLIYVTAKVQIDIYAAGT